MAFRISFYAMEIVISGDVKATRKEGWVVEHHTTYAD